MNRRSLITGLGALLFAPAVVRAGSLMPVRSITPVADAIERAWFRGDLIEAGTFHVERSLRLQTNGFPVMRKCNFLFPAMDLPYLEFLNTITGGGLISSCSFILEVADLSKPTNEAGHILATVEAIET